MTQIVHATPDQNERARQLCRATLDLAVKICAGLLNDQPLSVRALFAKLLVEDFVALSPEAAAEWLHAARREVEGCEDGAQRRLDAFTHLALSEMEREARA